jgi:predicted MFS family arabinose efflux permease
VEDKLIDVAGTTDRAEDIVPYKPTHLAKSLVLIMSIACGSAAANLYYIQPLLAGMAHDFHVSASQIGTIATLGQIGYTIGLLLIVPLGDKLNQRTLIVTTTVAVTISLAIMAFAPTLALLGVASLLVGIATVAPQLIVPYAASLAPEQSRGRVVGSVMSGLLIGILVARTLSGFVGETLGWRIMYWIAAGLMILLAVILRVFLPNDPTTKGTMSYPRLLRSLWDVLRDEPVLHEVCIFGSLTFATFSTFWVTLSFLLETPPYHFGSEVAGLFGLIGVAGAAAASVVGKMADQRDPRFANGISMGMTLFSFVLMWLVGQWLIGLIIGVILLDLGVQANHISNQARIYSLKPETRNRLNTVYMVTYFVGGSLGSFSGTLGWSLAGWNGVCVAGCSQMALALACYVFSGSRKRTKLRKNLPA